MGPVAVSPSGELSDLAKVTTVGVRVAVAGVGWTIAGAAPVGSLPYWKPAVARTVRAVPASARVDRVVLTVTVAGGWSGAKEPKGSWTTSSSVPAGHATDSPVSGWVTAAPVQVMRVTASGPFAKVAET